MMYNLYIMQTSQSLARTQIYLTQTQQARLRVASRLTAKTKSELIRQAINQFLDNNTPESADVKAQRMQHMVGLWAERGDMADPAAYVRTLRAPRFAQPR
jgi:predicted DNA-binding protein